MKYTHKEKYSEDSVLEIHLLAKPHIVEYLIDECVVYQSSSTPANSLHFQICFGDEKARVTDACFVMKTLSMLEGADDCPGQRRAGPTWHTRAAGLRRRCQCLAAWNKTFHQRVSSCVLSKRYLLSPWSLLSLFLSPRR